MKKKNNKPQPKKQKPGFKAGLASGFAWFKRTVLWILPKRQWLRRVVLGLMAIILLSVSTMYGIARWYMASESSKPVTLGVSFIPNYAKQLGVDPHDTMKAMISQLGVKNFRLVSYWSDIEPSPGQYNFSELDWEFQQVNAVHGSVSLSLGLRQPRWPECHMPSWANNEPVSEWEPQLEQFMQLVVNRYKNNPALSSYQVENEYFLKVFGQCTNFSRDRLISEYNLVKQLDPKHTVIINRSNNALGVPVGKPTPDEFGVSIYKRVWDATITHRYFEYPFPAWFYGFLAGADKIATGKDTIIHELQAEPWGPNGMQIQNTSLAEQSKSLDAARLKDRFQYGEATGIKTIYLWGAEYWYYRKTVEHDPSVWNAAQQQFQLANLKNQKLLQK